MKKIYLDCCCLNRSFDDQRQDRIYLESEVVLVILKAVEKKKVVLVGSTVLNFEINNISSKAKKEKVLSLYKLISYEIPYWDEINKIAKGYLRKSEIKSLDSLHIASAELEKVDFFVTTDDRLIKFSNTLNLKMKV